MDGFYCPQTPILLLVGDAFVCSGLPKVKKVVEIDNQWIQFRHDDVGLLQKVSTVLQWWGKKTDLFDPHLIFPNIFRIFEIFYDKVPMGPKFFPQNYGARMWPWEPPLAHNSIFWTFQNNPNPGGDVGIWDFFLRVFCTLRDNANWLSISYSTIFGYKIILKIRIFMVTTEISKSKYLAYPSIRAIPQYRAPYPKIILESS